MYIKLYETRTGATGVIALRIREATEKEPSYVYVSGDDTSFFRAANWPPVTGGLLTDALPDTGPDEEEDGPVIEITGPDFSRIAQTLSDKEWRAGRQVAVINDELLWIREFDPLGGDLYQAKGVLRSVDRTGNKGDHSQKDMMFLGPSTSFVPVYHRVIKAGETVYFKHAPTATSTSISITGRSQTTPKEIPSDLFANFPDASDFPYTLIADSGTNTLYFSNGTIWVAT